MKKLENGYGLPTMNTQQTGYGKEAANERQLVGEICPLCGEESVLEFTPSDKVYCRHCGAKLTSKSISEQAKGKKIPLEILVLQDEFEVGPLEAYDNIAQQEFEKAGGRVTAYDLRRALAMERSESDKRIVIDDLTYATEYLMLLLKLQQANEMFRVKDAGHGEYRERRLAGKPCPGCGTGDLWRVDVNHDPSHPDYWLICQKCGKKIQIVNPETEKE